MKNAQNNSRPAKHIGFCLLVGIIIGLGGCATTSKENSANNKADPYENFNRKVFGFNNNVDTYVAKPISNTYKAVTPDFMQTGVSNFFNNLKNINVILNDVFQAKFEQSGRDTRRFLMNSTLGMAGLFDVAKTVGLEQNDEDFEQTLAVWGVPQGTYFVLPFWGPVTTRGIPGGVFDAAANPSTYVGVGLPIASVQMLSLVNTRAGAEGALKFIDEAALDPYVFTRESFLQWRSHLATDGKTETSTDLTDIDSELLGDVQGNDKQADVDNGAASSTKAYPSSSANPNTEDNAASSLGGANNKNTLRIPPADSLGVDKNSTGNALVHPGKIKKNVVVHPQN
jgi:phospholipid-binding lipoprotein MlaA